MVFGATGDLMTRKIIPALFHLYRKGKLPRFFRLIGVSRQQISDSDWQKKAGQVLQKHLPEKVSPQVRRDFLRLFSYERTQFKSRKDYFKLAEKLGRIDGEWKVCANKLFYLAVPPQHYKTILTRLAESKLTEPCGPDEGWTRVLVEKPFGRNLKTAAELDKLLGRLFKEEQIYRIDHYLAKEMLQNILSFRFSNNLFEPSWHKNFIESIEVRLLEKSGAESRGSFYDGIGALRDMGQNHLLQMLAVVAMDNPLKTAAVDIRRKRAEFLQTLPKMSPAEIAKQTFRAQYKGYSQITGVAKNSTTETYFKINTVLTGKRWQGVPVTLENGKKMERSLKEIVVNFKHPKPCLCPDNHHFQNKIVFSLEPYEGIRVQFWSKKPGLTTKIQEGNFSFALRQKRQPHQQVEEYEKLLLDCILGDQTLFVSTAEVTAMWRFVDPILKAWQKNLVPLTFYS